MTDAPDPTEHARVLSLLRRLAAYVERVGGYMTTDDQALMHEVREVVPRDSKAAVVSRDSKAGP